jgi:hypothetical protein
MLAIILVALVFAGLFLSKALVLLPLGTLALLQFPLWLSGILLIALAAWLLGD